MFWVSTRGRKEICRTRINCVQEKVKTQRDNTSYIFKVFYLIEIKRLIKYMTQNIRNQIFSLQYYTYLVKYLRK